MCLLSSADFFLSKLTFSKNSFDSTFRVSNGLDPDQFCRSSPGFRLFAMVISRRQKSPLARNALQTSKYCCILIL